MAVTSASQPLQSQIGWFWPGSDFEVEKRFRQQTISELCREVLPVSKPGFPTHHLQKN
jgi:hypothetical protein